MSLLMAKTCNNRNDLVSFLHGVKSEYNNVKSLLKHII